MPEWDVFISRAGEDKDDVARPLARLLQEDGFRVWLDENELTLGDSLSRKIDEGLARSTHGVVVLSEHFFQKAWPAYELAGLAARQIGGRKIILPVWHRVTREFILEYSPTLADVLAVKTDDGLPFVVAEIERAIRVVRGDGALALRPLAQQGRPTSHQKTRVSLKDHIVLSAFVVIAVVCATIGWLISSAHAPPNPVGTTHVSGVGVGAILAISPAKETILTDDQRTLLSHLSVELDQCSVRGYNKEWHIECQFYIENHSEHDVGIELETKQSLAIDENGVVHGPTDGQLCRLVLEGAPTCIIPRGARVFGSLNFDDVLSFKTSILKTIRIVFRPTADPSANFIAEDVNAVRINNPYLFSPVKLR
jgi:hypothetical protein